MDKRGISPLLSTVFLLLIAIGIGILVMNWGRAALEANSKCSITSDLSFVMLNSEPQVCYSGKGNSGFIKFIVENGVSADITALQFRAIGSKQPYEMTLESSAIAQGYTLQKEVPYDFEVFGEVRQVRIMPKVLVYPGEPAVLCPEQAIIAENIKPC